MPSLQVSVPGQATTSTIVPAPALAEADRLQFLVQRGHVFVRHPAEHDVLLDGRAGSGRTRTCATRSASWRHLVGRRVAQRAGDGDGRVAGLPLAVDVGLDPAVVRLAELLAVDAELDHLRPGFARRFARSGGSRRRTSASRPGLPASCAALRRRARGTSRCRASATTNFSRALLRFFFSPSRAKTRPIARAQRQQFFFGTELRQQLRLVRHRAEAAADVELEAADFLAVDHLAWRRCRRGRAWLTSAHASCLQPENAILNLRPKSCVSRVAEQVERDRPWRRA